METRHYWEENGHTLKYDNFNRSNGFGPSGAEQLTFTAASDDEGDYPTSGFLKKGKVARQDPMSHRIIEKRRRDRMNNCLADLSRLIPPEYLKKGRGRVEKTEIIEMAIRHLKFLQERANAVERQLEEEPFRAGYQDAVTEVLRFLIEVHGYGPGDGLCAQLAAHMQMHCDAVTKGDSSTRDKSRPHGSSSETTSSSSSSHNYGVKSSSAEQPEEVRSTFNHESYEEQLQDQTYNMECDRGAVENSQEAGPLPLDGRRQMEPTLRTVRKPEHIEDHLHYYKFKNSIERRFSKSQDNEAAEISARSAHAHKMYSHKRRRNGKHAPSTSTSASGSTEETRNTSPQLREHTTSIFRKKTPSQTETFKNVSDTSSDSPRHQHYEKPPLPTQYVPVFALNAVGKYYVPLSVDYACLSKHLGPYDLLDARAVQLAAPLHPVTIHVNFQPCINYNVKREIDDREWRPV